MADISDVEQALANAVNLTLYPSGLSQPSIVGSLCRIYRGWPNSATLNADLSSGNVNITVITDNDAGRITTRYLPAWQTTFALPGVAVSAATDTITVSGAPVVGDVVGALIDGKAYAYRIQLGDTADLVASNLSVVIQSDRIAIAQGLAIIVPGAVSIKVRAVSDQTTSFESRRQEKDVRIICWCPTPQIRDFVSITIDSAVDQMSFLILPDGTNARIIYHNTASYDQAQNALLYRRDLIYKIEYPTILVSAQPSMLFGASELNSNITYG